MADLIAKFRDKLELLIGSDAVARIRECARNEAMSASARDSIDDLTQHESKAMNNCVTLLRELHCKGTEAQNEYHRQRLGARRDCVSELSTMPREAASKVTGYLHACHERVQASYRKKNQLIKVLRAYQDEHNIHDVPEDSNKILNFSILAIMLVVETFLNGSMLAKTNLYGLVGAWSAAILISFGNLSIGFVNGLCSMRYLRLVIEKDNLTKTIGMALITIVLFAFIGVYNFVFAHYRHITEPNMIDNIQYILSSMLDKPFSISASIKNLSLFIMGLVFSGVSTYEGYVTYTPYWGYYKNIIIGMNHDWIATRFDSMGCIAFLKYTLKREMRSKIFNRYVIKI